MENNKSLFEHFSFKVDKGQEPLRIDKYLMNFVENATRTKIQAAAKKGSIQVNGLVVKSNYKVKPEDQIKVLFEYPPQENELIAEKINIDPKVFKTSLRFNSPLTKPFKDSVRPSTVKSPTFSKADSTFLKASLRCNWVNRVSTRAMSRRKSRKRIGFSS